MCLTGLTDTPKSTMMDVQLPAGDVIRILSESLQWFTDPIQMGNMHVYSRSMATEGPPMALLGGVPGSEWLGGFGLWGVIETAENIRTMRVLLGKRHCNGLYPKDLYFSSRRFTNLATEVRKVGLAELVADVKQELRRHRFAFPATDLEVLLSELSSRSPATEVVRDLIHTAIWPLDYNSRLRMQYVRNHFFLDADASRRNLDVLVQEMGTFLGGYQSASVRGRVPYSITGIAEEMFRAFGWRKDDVSIEDMALLFVRNPHFTESALQYLEVKGSSNAAEALRRTAVQPQFEPARNSTVQKISERLKSRGERQ